MAHLLIDVLGPLEVKLGSEPVIKMESVKVRALLAYLAVEADRPHSRAELVGLLWPDYPEESARHSLRQALFNLRSALDDHHASQPYFLLEHDSIQFNRESDYSLDVDRFNQYFFNCPDNLPEGIEDSSIHAANLEEMVKLYRGEFLQHLFVDDSTEFEEWSLSQRERLNQRVIEAYSYLANYYELHADLQAARAHLAHLLELDPWREDAHRQMMRVLALDGQRSSALAQYEKCKQVLAQELDVEPAVETRDLYEQIRSGSFDQVPGKPAHYPVAPVNNLPVQLTPFIGRAVEQREITNQLTNPECRCLSLVGPGGIGKTRLAIQVASGCITRFAQGAGFVSLASVESDVGVVTAIANAINLSFYGSGDPKTNLLSYLKEKQLLLLLDNVEHLLSDTDSHENVTQLMVEILQAAPQVRLLVTSREALNIQGETIFDVQGMAYPQADQREGIEELDSVTLFVQRARRASPNFALGAGNQADIAQICRLVEGMPLAIELAATWMRVLSPHEIAAEIIHSLDFLSTSLRDLPERHRSMRVVFDHSWQMLSAEDQGVLSKLSVFRGGFQRKAAEQVAGATLSSLSTLVNRALLRRTVSGRYELHELVRQYCADQLAANAMARLKAQEQHYAYCLELAQTSDRELRSRNQLEWLARLEQEHENLRAALAWALEGDENAKDGNMHALRLAGSLRWFWRMHSHFHEGCYWLSEALRRQTEMHTIERATALSGIGLLINGLGDLRAALPPSEAAILIHRELGNQDGLAEALMVSGLTLLWQGEAAEGQAFMHEAMEIYCNIEDRWGEAHALYRLGSFMSDHGGDPMGRTFLEKSAVILDTMDEKYLNTSVQLCLGIIDLSRGDYPLAKQRIERSLAMTREIKHPWGIADALTNLGCLMRIQGKYAEAQALFEESLQVYQEHGRNIWQTDVHCALAENALAQGDFSNARQHLDTAASLIGSSENKWLQVLVCYFRGLQAFYEGEDEQAHEYLAQAVQSAREGRFRTDLARALVTLGRVQLKLGAADQARQSVCEGLSLFHEFGHKLGVANALEALAEVSLSEGDARQAVELFAIASSIRLGIGAFLPPVEKPVIEAKIQYCERALGKESFKKLWQAAVMTPYEEITDKVKDLSG